MTQVIEPETTSRKLTRRYPLFLAIFAILALLLSTVTYLVGVNNGAQAQSGAHAATFTSPCAATFPVSQWSPVGKRWTLTVKFLSGSRANPQPDGQPASELSVMTFAADGSLTATFPGATLGAPSMLPPAVDGHWCWTSANTFHYGFRDIQMNGQTAVAYVQTQIGATMTSATIYQAGGVGVAYDAKTNKPIPQQFGVTQTIAVATN